MYCAPLTRGTSKLNRDEWYSPRLLSQQGTSATMEVTTELSLAESSSTVEPGSSLRMSASTTRPLIVNLPWANTAAVDAAMSRSRTASLFTAAMDVFLTVCISVMF